MNGSVICSNCGAIKLNEKDEIGNCDYCGSILTIIDVKGKFIDPIESELILDNSISLFFESFEFDGLDSDLFNSSINKLITCLKNSSFQRISKKIRLGFINNIYKINLDILIEINEILTLNNFSLEDNQLKLLHFISNLFIDKYKNDYMFEIQKEYNYYLDERYNDIYDQSFLDKKKQVISTYNQRKIEIEQQISLLTNINKPKL